jgi:hypothetical protein
MEFWNRLCNGLQARLVHFTYFYLLWYVKFVERFGGENFKGLSLYFDLWLIL